MLLLGDYDDIVDNNIDIYEKEGWTLVDYNLNKGAGGQSIYLLYQTTYNNVIIPAITDFYIKSTSDKNDHPDQLTYNNRTYHRITGIVGSDSFMSSYGDLNDGAGGKYIYLYYTIDAWDYPRGITSIAFNDDSFGAVCGNGSTTPQDINEGAGGDYIYMHYGYTLTTDVVDVDDQDDFAPLNAHSDEPLYFRLSDNAVNGSVVIVSTINVGNNNTAVIDLNGKAFSRLIQSGGSGENGHVLKVTDNSTLTVFDGSIHGTGSISGGDVAPETLVHTQQLEITGTVGDIVTFRLDTPIEIDGTQNIWFTFYHDGSIQYPAPAVPDVDKPNSRWLGIDGYGWMDVASVTSPAYSWLTMVYIDGYDWINESNETISVYPNPTTDNVNILAPGINHVTVMNTLGQVVLDTHVDGNMTTLDMSSYQAGVYMVRVTTENGQSVKLITKQ